MSFFPNLNLFFLLTKKCVLRLFISDQATNLSNNANVMNFQINPLYRNFNPYENNNQSKNSKDCERLDENKYANLYWPTEACLASQIASTSTAISSQNKTTSDSPRKLLANASNRVIDDDALSQVRPFFCAIV